MRGNSKWKAIKCQEICVIRKWKKSGNDLWICWYFFQGRWLQYPNIKSHENRTYRLKSKLSQVIPIINVNSCETTARKLHHLFERAQRYVLCMRSKQALLFTLLPIEMLLYYFHERKLSFNGVSDIYIYTSIVARYVEWVKSLFSIVDGGNVKLGDKWFIHTYKQHFGINTHNTHDAV